MQMVKNEQTTREGVRPFYIVSKKLAVGLSDQIG
jgi:hypothetical protein